MKVSTNPLKPSVHSSRDTEVISSLWLYVSLPSKDADFYREDPSVRQIGNQKFVPCLPLLNEQVSRVTRGHPVGEPFHSEGNLSVILERTPLTKVTS